MSAGPRSHPRNREWPDPKSRLEKPESRNRWPQWLGLGVWFDELQRLPTQLRLPQKGNYVPTYFPPAGGAGNKVPPLASQGPVDRSIVHRPTASSFPSAASAGPCRAVQVCKPTPDYVGAVAHHDVLAVLTLTSCRVPDVLQKPVDPGMFPK